MNSETRPSAQTPEGMARREISGFGEGGDKAIPKVESAHLAWNDMSA